MASIKLGLDQAILGGLDNSGGQKALTKEEVEKLLKHGAYDIFQDLNKDGTSEDESNKFISEDIDSILARRTKTIIHENTGSNAVGGAFSKASFKDTASPDVAGEGVDVDDPEFWTKVVGEVKEEEEEQLGKRKCAQQSYSEKDYLRKLDADIRESDSEEDVDDVDNSGFVSSEYNDSGESSDESFHLEMENLHL